MGSSTVLGVVSNSYVQTVTLAASPTFTTLLDFDDTDGGTPDASLIVNPAGNLFGTTYYGGTNGDGTVFELANTGTGYAGTPAILGNFTNSSGYNPHDGLIADAAGDLFGTTFTGGEYGDGTVFEIVNTSTGYATAPAVLTSFNGANGRGIALETA
jgi:uncharacterized repeat protein (TIGR03803 family)